MVQSNAAGFSISDHYNRRFGGRIVKKLSVVTFHSERSVLEIRAHGCIDGTRSMQLELLYGYRRENTQNGDDDNKFKQSETFVR